MSGQPEAVTRDELETALRELSVRSGNGNTFYPALADHIVAFALSRREPGYEPGEIYQSPTGFRYLRLPDESGTALPWLLLGRDGTVIERLEDVPDRPLTRLVPEGSPLADSERDLIRADLGKLLDLLGLGDFARPASSHEVFGMCLEAVAKLVGKREETCPGGC